ncbi:hypothetical protein BOX15_Mlig003040g3 [Macrostomum lignano]|uniref:Major facilitator superfamily (MFS) profile domain-containing protein n=1 Tax=Macrostomum lignano TaxID=282301 RepID=A0A267DSL8_9PLAT|nr:hypothetical protein BOX15_Mlig003040g1 [Macrostomum lignano]PAA74821.1 hypothetical protein BOX15_Mlig003040g3 [Macrostomum lignano]
MSSTDEANNSSSRSSNEPHRRDESQLLPLANGGSSGDNLLVDDDDEDDNVDEASSSAVRKSGQNGGGAAAAHLYRRRWLVLLLFSSYSMSSAYQWIHLNIVFDVVLSYYNESLPADSTEANLAIDWLSMIYMLAYVVFILPAAWLLQRFGLRVSAICATSLNFAGALVKCFAAAPDRFWLLFLGQILCAIAQNFILGMPAPLAAAWFGLDELPTATALGVFGNQLGVAVGFVVPPLFVSRGTVEDMGGQLLAMYIGGAAVTGLLLGLVVAMFKEGPPTPPTIARRLDAAVLLNGEQPPVAPASVRASQTFGSLASIARIGGGGVISGGGGGGGGVGSSYTGSLKRLASNPGFVLLTVSYGLNTGTYYALSTLLNPIIVPEMRKADVNATLTTDIEQQVGWAGFTMIAAGILGSVLAGIVLGKTKAFKCTTLAIYVLSCLSTVGFAATLPLASMWLVFAAMFLLGLFMTGYLPVGFEFAAEITYPENEGLSSGILNASAQLMGIICTMVVRMVVDRVSTLAGNIIFCCLLVAGSVMTAVIKSDLRRQRANQAAMSGAAPAHTAARRSSNHNREAELLADIENELEADKLA